MSDPSPEEIAHGLTPRQLEIVLSTPENWAEADELPYDLFDHDETYDSETAEESGFWFLTEPGGQVHSIVSAEEGRP